VIGRNSLFECWSGDARSSFSAPEIKCENQRWPLIALGPPDRRTAITQLIESSSAARLRDHQLKKERRLSQGRLAETRWRFFRPDGFSERTANRGCAASCNKTNFPLSIFTNFGVFFLKSVLRIAAGHMRDVHAMHLDGSRNRADAAQPKTEHPGIRFPRSKSYWLRDPSFGSIRERKHAAE
jgi:hypothetical protein